MPVKMKETAGEKVKRMGADAAYAAATWVESKYGPQVREGLKAAVSGGAAGEAAKKIKERKNAPR